MVASRPTIRPPQAVKEWRIYCKRGNLQSQPCFRSTSSGLLYLFNSLSPSPPLPRVTGGYDAPFIHFARHTPSFPSASVFPAVPGPGGAPWGNCQEPRTGWDGRGLPATVETPVVLVERERKVGGDPGYVTRKDAVTISPVHRASLAAASPPPHRRRHIPGLHNTPQSTIPDMEGRSNINPRGRHE